MIDDDFDDEDHELPLDPALLIRARVALTGQEVMGVPKMQRALRIGYNEAARVIDQLEAEGLISYADINGRRTVRTADGRLPDPGPRPPPPPEPSPNLEQRSYDLLIKFFNWIARMRGRDAV